MMPGVGGFSRAVRTMVTVCRSGSGCPGSLPSGIWAAFKNPGTAQPRTLALTCITSHSLTTRQQPLPLSWRVASEPVSDALAVRRRR